MLDGLNPAIFNGVGVVGICVLIVIAYMMGWVVSRRTHQDALSDRDRWRDLAEKLQTQNTRLLIVSELGLNSIRAIEEKAAEYEGGAST